MSARLPLRAFQWDLARQVERLDVLLALLPRYAEWGYQELYLHLEDAVEYPSVPGIARADAYSHRQLGRLVDAATRAGIEVVPIVNLLGHTQYLIKVPELRELNECRAIDGSPLERGQICPLHPDTPGVAEKLLRDMAPFCTAGKVHVGLDESFQLGKCPRCRAEIAARGLAAHFTGHVERLHTLTASLGLRMGLWADMLNFIPDAIRRLPRDVIAYDWYYYAFGRHPRVELFNFAESDLATPLRKRGIEYWGCPMNGAFRYEPLPIFRDRLANLRSWWRRCQRTDAAGFLVTSWEAYRLAFEMTTVVDAAAASLWLNPEIADDDHALLTRGFARVFGKSGASRAAKTALACDAHAFAGYARWEINDRWDVGAPAASAVGAALRRDKPPPLPALPHTASNKRPALPAPLAASIRFLAYLVQRDAFVASAADGVSKLRRLETASDGLAQLRQLERAAREFSRQWKDGQSAARAMWSRTRNPRVRGQNETILAADRARLAAWKTWLRHARSDPAHIRSASPVCGRWQLTFVVHNFAPALQKIVVEQKQPDGSWRELHSRYTIEFRSEAARPHANIARLFSCPIEDPRAPLRIALRGLGQIALGDFSLSDGVTSLRVAATARQKVVLGKPAPRRGFPDITQTHAVLPLPLP